MARAAPIWCTSNLTEFIFGLTNQVTHGARGRRFPGRRLRIMQHRWSLPMSSALALPLSYGVTTSGWSRDLTTRPLIFVAALNRMCWWKWITTWGPQRVYAMLLRQSSRWRIGKMDGLG